MIPVLLTTVFRVLSQSLQIKFLGSVSITRRLIPSQTFGNNRPSYKAMLYSPSYATLYSPSYVTLYSSGHATLYSPRYATLQTMSYFNMYHGAKREDKHLTCIHGFYGNGSGVLTPPSAALWHNCSMWVTAWPQGPEPDTLCHPTACYTSQRCGHVL